MESDLKGRVVLITGASGGIGRALARAFGAEGARLALVAGRRREELARFTAEQPWAERALVLAADLERPEPIATAFAEAEKRLGPVEIAIANAGVWPREDRLLHEAAEERILRTVTVNLLGAIWTARAFMAALDRQRDRVERPALLLIGSTAGRFGEAGHADYAAAKAGLRGLAASLKNELVRIVPGARVNVIEPGWTVTELARPELETPGRVARALATVPLRRLGRADEIARAAVFLASPRLSPHVTGEVLTVAGGMEGRLLWDPSTIDEQRVREEAGGSP
ncbi:MAG: SDR family oxidoreductase [Acidobacteria bacterium]|nr:MAG: SDR family oxidoreductase [Acidobacteriota bacterium]